ncbi:MAG: hypothetical protein ACLQMH_14245 [Solirubrobacteraceae bacterium]
MHRPPLLTSRPPALRVLIVLLGPILAGAVGGWLLGESSTWYLVYVTVMILGAIAGGMEHATPRGGTLRGLSGGALFAASILVTHELIGGPMAATLPSPPVLIVVIYGAVGALLGRFGAIMRRRFKPAV